MKKVVTSVATYCLWFAIIALMNKITSFETAVFFALAHLCA